jgi:hypothetical protein
LLHPSVDVASGDAIDIHEILPPSKRYSVANFASTDKTDRNGLFPTDENWPRSDW